MPGFVPDASATLPWRFENEATPWTEALLDRIQSGEEVLVPAHWPLEVANALLIARRRGRVTSEQISEFVEDLAALPIRFKPPAGPERWSAILALAERHRLTAYDAAYLELVQRMELPLATLDDDLRKAPRPRV
jgi:predicted nucleic acid-binding protein